MNRQHPRDPQAPHHGGPDTADFDRAMRNLHVEGLDRIPPATLARLRSASRKAVTAEASRGYRWQLAGACAAVVALALVLNLQSPQTAPDPPALVVEPPPEAADAAVAAFDENPDLYLWLASNDDAVPPSSEYRP